MSRESIREGAISNRPAASMQGGSPEARIPSIVSRKSPVSESKFWWIEAAKCRAVAREVEDPAQQAELLDLAEACEVVAMTAQDRVGDITN